MTTAIIITLCTLLLIAYVFDLTSSKTKIPSVVLLLMLGWTVKQITLFLDIYIPDLSPILPGLGTIGLILIVLEGSLELELNKSKIGLIVKSFFGALIPLLVLSFLIGYAVHYFGNIGFKDSLTNAIPLCIISSAIAIPSAKNFPRRHKEFIIYESSLSDILGVLLFNFFALNDTIDIHSFSHFILQFIIITVISFVATIGLSLLLSKIEHHIKFFPIILLVILVYAISKVYHIPGLILILIFGLFIGNIDELKRFQWIEMFKPEELNNQIRKFKELTIEATFLIRTLFFLLFGYLIDSNEVLNYDTLVWASSIVIIILILRAIQLKLSKLPLIPLLFIAPRGLITILLFFSIDPLHSIPLINKSLITQVIILTAFVMMFGLMISKSHKEH